LEEKILSVLNQLVEGQERLTIGLEKLTKGQEELSRRQDEFSRGQEKLWTQVAKLTEGQGELSAQVTQIRTTLENETNVQIRALFDARDAQNEINNRIFESLDRLEKKVDRLQIETAHVRIVK